MFELIWSEKMMCMGNSDNPCPKCKQDGSKWIQFKKGDMAKYTCTSCGHVWFLQWKLQEDKSKIKL